MTLYSVQLLKGNLEGYLSNFQHASEDILPGNQDAVFRLLLIGRSFADNSIRDLLAKCADARFILEETDSFSAGLQRLEHQGIDMVLLDSKVADSASLQGLGTLRSSFPGVPVILLSDFGDKARFPEALRMGAKDCVVKGSIDGHLLGRAILRHIKGT
jgi:DNA-binding NarL/FixJ family response regulator